MGFSLVEVLSSCLVNWGKNPAEALKFVKEEMIPFYPLGDYKVADGVKTSQ
jgi:2-oxoglutarate ferredoxin oxidoreductase subunit beta